MVDVVSKNGNYLLNIPVRGNGTIDELERNVVEEIGRWMKVNSESIYDTRPWKIYGEGPSTENQAKLTGQGFNEGKTKFTASDIRFNTKDEVLYATVMAWPQDGKVVIKSLAKGNPHRASSIQKVEWLSGRQSLQFEQTSEGLVINLPQSIQVDSFANVFKII